MRSFCAYSSTHCNITLHITYLTKMKITGFLYADSLLMFRKTDRQTDRQTDRHTDRQTARQTDRQPGSQAGRQIYNKSVS